STAMDPIPRQSSTAREPSPRSPTRRSRLGSWSTPRIVEAGGTPCADGLQTLVDLAATLDDAVWEQAPESALRMRLVAVADLEQALPDLGRSRTPGHRSHAPGTRPPAVRCAGHRELAGDPDDPAGPRGERAR